METQKSANLLDLMTPEDRGKAERAAQLREATKEELVTHELMILAELGVSYGWEAVRDVMNDVITLQTAKAFNQAARKLHSSDVIDTAMATRAASVAKTKDFAKMMAPYFDSVKVAD